LIAILILAAGSYALRSAGPLLGSRVSLPEPARRIMTTAATLLLAALVAITALTDGGGFSGWSRTIGVAVAAVLALRRAPFPVVVVAAALTAALLRLAGVD
jgi:branched-subunit amino acid transport protein